MNGDAVDRLDALRSVLACPRCGSAVAIEADERLCRCPRHGEFRFAGVFPSFVEARDGLFEDHWERHESPGLPERKLAEARAFLQPILGRLAGDRPLRVLDAGCGEGAHIAAFSEVHPGAAGDLLVGLDIAVSALRRAQQGAAGAWRFVHGDMMHLPFRSGSFDLVFSFGVLALTPDPMQALGEMARVLRTGGLLGLWVYCPSSWLLRAGLTVLRTLSRRLGAAGTAVLADAVVPVYGLLPTRSGLSFGNATWRQVREVLMSNLTPPNLHFLDEGVLRARLAAAGVTVLPEIGGEALTLWGCK